MRFACDDGVMGAVPVGADDATLLGGLGNEGKNDDSFDPFGSIVEPFDGNVGEPENKRKKKSIRIVSDFKLGHHVIGF